MDIYAKKEHFVRTSLKEMLFDTDKNILDVYYKYQDSEEIVTIVYFKGSSANVKINVTGDSLLAIAHDVIKRLLV